MQDYQFIFSDAVCDLLVVAVGKFEEVMATVEGPAGERSVGSERTGAALSQEHQIDRTLKRLRHLRATLDAEQHPRGTLVQLKLSRPEWATLATAVQWAHLCALNNRAVHRYEGVSTERWDPVIQALAEIMEHTARTEAV